MCFWKGMYKSNSYILILISTACRELIISRNPEMSYFLETRVQLSHTHTHHAHKHSHTNELKAFECKWNHSNYLCQQIWDNHLPTQPSETNQKIASNVPFWPSSIQSHKIHNWRFYFLSRIKSSAIFQCFYILNVSWFQPFLTIHSKTTIVPATTPLFLGLLH